MLDIAELNDFINFSQIQWPTIKSQYLDEITPRCINCIASSIYTQLNQKTLLCTLCNENSNNLIEEKVLLSKKNWIDPKELDKLILSSKKNSIFYDAMILFSGGKDSIYLIHSLARKYKNLKMLTLFIDNGFQSPIAVKNINKTLAMYDNIDHVHFKVGNNLFEKMYQYVLTHAKQLKGYAQVDDFDGFLTFDIGRNFAYRLNIPLVFSGLTNVQAREYFHAKLLQPIEESKLKRTQLYGIELNKFHDENELKYWWDGTNKLNENIPKFVFPLAAESLSEYAITQELINVNLIKTTENHPFYTNSSILPLIMMLDFKHHGYSSIEPKLSKMIRRNEANKKFWINHLEAIEFLIKKDKFLIKSINQILNKLKLSKKQLGVL